MDKKNGIYGFKGTGLSNFYPCDITYEGITYPSVENAYQAAKFSDFTMKTRFINCSPSQAKILGKKKQFIRKDWFEVNIKVMKELNVLKYKHEPFKSLLLNTDELYLEETNTWGDAFWGVFGDKGENHLGLILMEIRSELKNEILLTNLQSIHN